MKIYFEKSDGICQDRNKDFSLWDLSAGNFTTIF